MPELGLFPGLDKSLGASCKDSIGWMFSKLDTSADLFLDQTELAAINLDKYEVCIRPFFNSCDTYKDGRVSTAEWCFCFWRESECDPSPRPLPHPCGLCLKFQALLGSQSGSFLATSPDSALSQLAHFLHSLRASSFKARGSQHFQLPYLAGSQADPDFVGPDAYILLEVFFKKELKKIPSILGGQVGGSCDPGSWRPAQTIQGDLISMKKKKKKIARRGSMRLWSLPLERPRWQDRLSLGG